MNVSLTPEHAEHPAVLICVSEERRRCTKLPPPVRGASVITWWRLERRSWRQTCRWTTLTCSTHTESWAVETSGNAPPLLLKHERLMFSLRDARQRLLPAARSRFLHGHQPELDLHHYLTHFYKVINVVCHWGTKRRRNPGLTPTHTKAAAHCCHGEAGGNRKQPIIWVFLFSSPANEKSPYTSQRWAERPLLPSSHHLYLSTRLSSFSICRISHFHTGKIPSAKHLRMRLSALLVVLQGF